MLKLVSWNVNRRALWSDIGADVDIALLQEAPRPPADGSVATLPVPESTWVTEGWTHEARTCLVNFNGDVELRPRRLAGTDDESDVEALGVSRQGTLTVADVVRDDEHLFTVVSAYGAWERPPGSDLLFADASAHRLLSDLSTIVTGRRDERVLVAGDLNILHGYGEHGDAYFAARYQTVFDRAEAMGLEFVGPQHPGGRQADPWPEELPRESRNVPTFHHSRQRPETATRQLDFAFATKALSSCVSARALNKVDEWGPSDHCPIEISVDV